jgi:hypothetical protein
MNRRAFLGSVSAAALLHAEAARSELVYRTGNGRLEYRPDALGNRIPDFSSCGWGGGLSAMIPGAEERVEIAPESGDSTERIQTAIEHVSALHLDARGLRGAVLLKRGRHAVAGTLRITASGVVLRGEAGTVLVGTGPTQRNLIEIRGAAAGRASGSAVAVTADYVPVGATVIPVRTSRFEPGQDRDRAPSRQRRMDRRDRHGPHHATPRRPVEHGAVESVQSRL